MPISARYYAGLAAVLMAALAAQLAAQSYPSKVVKIIMPFPIGGTNDIIARAVGDRLAPLLKQPVVIENRGGAGGLIGTDAVAKAPPEGYTLLVSNTNSLAAVRAPRAKEAVATPTD